MKAFEQLTIQYYIGASVASSLYGMARATMDIDIVAEIKAFHIPKLKQLLEEEYYLDEDLITEAIHSSASFNLIHFETAFKIDIFIYKDEPHQRNAIKRKVKDKFVEDLVFEFYFSAPEDLIIAKLQWHVQGNKVSERQWLDIMGIIKVHAGKLDLSYLKSSTKKLALYDLLKKAFLDCDIQLEE